MRYIKLTIQFLVLVVGLTIWAIFSILYIGWEKLHRREVPMVDLI